MSAARLGQIVRYHLAAGRTCLAVVSDDVPEWTAADRERQPDIDEFVLLHVFHHERTSHGLVGGCKVVYARYGHEVGEFDTGEPEAAPAPPPEPPR